MMHRAALPPRTATVRRDFVRPKRTPSIRRWKSYYRLDSQLEAEAGFGSQDDFYSILGVAPTADAKEIKRAYYGMMKECHPDLSYDEDSTEFCMLLNDIYETLADPTKRAVYDDLTGFSTEGVNPFREEAAATKVFVDEYTCIGCRNCSCVCPNTFTIEEDYGRARAMSQDTDPVPDLQDAIDTCPVSCIHWVSDRQLPWLQQSMASMPRAAVWAMMSGSGGGADVFSEAERRWERKRADLEAAIEADKWGAYWAANGQVAYNFWGATKQQKASDKQRQQDQQSARAGNSGRISELAARAAAASRRWRAAQAAKPKPELYVVY